MNLKRILATGCAMVLMVLSLSANPVEADTLGGIRSVATSPADLIRGEISGVRVSSVDGGANGFQNVHVRGLNTLRGDSQPLWIVDGVVMGSSANDNLDAFYLSGGLTANNDVLPDYSGQAYTSPIGGFGWLNPYDIESIEVLKDVSATALYGMRGANGVIIVKTRKPKAGEYNIRLDSNVGMETSPEKGDAFKTGILTTHSIGVDGLLGTNSFYSVSGFIRHSKGAVRNTGSTAGGVSVNLETSANSILQFGINSRLAYGDYLSASGVNYIGSPSMMLLSLYPDAFGDMKAGDYVGSHEDEAIDYRTVNSVWLNVNILRNLKLRISGGVDYQNQTRYVWYGKETPFGKKFNGAASILNNSLLNYNVKGELTYERSFAVKHHLQAALAFELNGDENRTNAMCGTDYTNPSLKAKGMTSTGSVQSVRKFIRHYGQMGGYVSVGYDYDGFAGIRGAVRSDYTMKYDRHELWLPSAEAFVDFKRIFLGQSEAVSTLKLSGGYGWAGREKVLPYQYLTSYILDVPEVDPGVEPYFDGMNRIISKEYNVGIDLGFLGDRYNVSLKYYDKNTSDDFKVYNFGKRLVNQWTETKNWKVHQERITSIRNSGFELDADFRFIQNRNLTWTLRMNAAYNINRAFDFDSKDVNDSAIVKDGSYIAESAEGRSLSEVLGHNTLPKVHGGLGTTLSLYGITLDADFSGAAGFSIFNAGKMLQKGEVKIAEDLVERGDYLRLDNLTVSYDVPLNVRWIKDFKVNLSAHNLFTVTGYSGWNPDVNSFGVTARSYGVDYGAFPLCRQFVLGVSFRF